MKIGVLAVSRGGRESARALAGSLPEGCFLEAQGRVAAVLRENWQRYDGFVCIMAAGIVVRAIAPLLADKRSDPAVVVVDEGGNYAVSLLSGHLGGGNSLARQVGAITGATPVITTASDTLGLVPLDLWAKTQGLIPATSATLTRASSMLVDRGNLNIFSEVAVDNLPQGLRQVQNRAECDLVISCSAAADDTPTLHPQVLVVGIGCNRGTPLAEFEQALAELFDRNGLAVQAVRNLASVDAKADEENLLRFADSHGWLVDFFAVETINDVSGIEVSEAAKQAIGAIGVAEPAALLSAQSKHLLIRKQKWQNVTMAVAQAPFSLSARVLEPFNI